MTRTTTTEWLLCAGCTTPMYAKRWAANLRVCPECSFHAPLTARERLEMLFDPGGWEPLAEPVTGTDPLGFVDSRPYPDRLAEARARTGLTDAVLCAAGTIGGSPVVAAAMEFRFMGGSMGTAAGELVTMAAETALARRVPLLLVTASGGARMQEGALSLMQLAKTSAALARLDESGLLTVSLIADPTFGGVAASFATLADVIVAEPGARLGFAGRRVIEQTIRQTLPKRFQTAEFLAERGFIDLILPRVRQRDELGHLLRVGFAAGHAERFRPDPEGDALVRDPAQLAGGPAWARVRAARDLGRPTAMEYISRVFDDFQELHGDRLSGDCGAVVGGTAWLHDRPVMVIGQQKGRTAVELAERNFAMATPAGYRKAARLMRLAGKLGLPVLTLVDTPGAYPGVSAEEQGQALAIAENLRLMASLRVPSVAVVIGEGGSGGALALAVSNRVLILSGGVYSVISPEGCAAILWGDPAATPLAAAALCLTPSDLLRLGIVDGVVPEPDGGAAADPCLAAERLRAALCACLAELSELLPENLVDERRARFRRFGAALH